MRKAIRTRARYFTAPIAAVLAMGTVLTFSSPARADEEGPASMNESGQHKYTNALIDSTSPYLLQHAHNPVNWNPWGPEALSKARSEDKPIFLSIGYAACHWCHVMERESFENEEIARVLNEHFVAIKVDREERPDLDEIYMAATVIYNQGQGGWPMSVFLTPDLKPFFAGTYFPPTSRYGRPGFRELLEQIATLWKSGREKLIGNADGLTQAVREYTAVVQGSATIKPETISKAVETLGGFFDTQYGGIGGGGTNKFPPSMAMALMLREYRHSVSAGHPKENSLRLVRLTLDRMARGGIYDHLGGGIARYSTDVRWLVPHFEKMLYDQALVSDIYVEAHQVTGDPFYASVATGIFDYVIDDLQSSEGGFFSTRDADSEGEEGKYYVWTLAELEGVLGGDDAKLFGSYYDVTGSGNWEGKNILNVSRPPEVVAKLNGMSVEELEGRLGPMREKLLAARARRVPPGLDDKILTSWNGLMIASLAKGGRVLDRDRYVGAARRAADFVLKDLRRDGRLLRSYRKGKAHIPGFLSDFAFFIEGLLNLYEATFEVRWLKAARELNEILVEHYYDEEKGGFFYAADDAERILVRTKDTGGSAVPSGNSVQYQNMLRLALLFDREDWREKNERTLAAFGARIAERPFSNERFLSSIDFEMSGVREIALVGAARDEATRKLIRTAFETFLPNKVVVLLDPDSPDADWLREHVPLVRGKTAKEGKPSAYVCRNYTCRAPVNTPEALAAQLR